MAIILLALNGVGLGHLSRLTEISDCLHAAGEKPMLFYQRPEFPYPEKDFHTISIKSLQKCDADYLARVEDKVNTLCSIAAPHIFIEDTHPAKIDVRKSTFQFMVVRPTTFSYLQDFLQVHQYKYTGFFIADHPDSPTWPYTEEETETIGGWEKFHFIGPIFRKAASDEIAALKLKYHWKEEAPIFVFAMGGGGQQLGSNDTETFLERSITLGNNIRQKHPLARLLFVKGPLYSGTRPIPGMFEVIEMEKNLPALFAIAKGAVIRPGFNSVWECIHAKTPFYFIPGTIYSEPIDQKMEKLAAHGLAGNERFLDPDFENSYKASCERVTDRWTGAPDASFLAAISKVRNEYAVSVKDNSFDEASVNAWTQEAKPILSAIPRAHPRKLFIRMDDVVEITAEVDFALSLAKKYGIFTSIEVIPYLSKLTEQDLYPYDHDHENIIVSQHGYSHEVNLANPARFRSEFSFSALPNRGEVHDLLKGQAYMRANFPQRYRNGFSAPFDQFPAWLATALADHGWDYMLANTFRNFFGVQMVRVRSDLWNWPSKRLSTAAELSRAIAGSVSSYKYCGLILHPIHFRSLHNRRFFEFVLEELAAQGFESFNFLQQLHQPDTSNKQG
jgi:hypothetical protein